MMVKNPYVLPKLVKPLKYVIELTPNLETFIVTGTETIAVKVLQPIKKILINVADVNITVASIDSTQVKKIVYNKKTETATLFFQKKIPKGNATLSLEFSSTIRDDMRGFYRSTYILPNGEKRSMATTQFEAVDARKCFPCFDEPALKATFGVTIIIPKNLDVISNMPIKSTQVSEEKKKVMFEETPIMSTYLLAFIVGEFEHVEKETAKGTLVRIITTPGKKEQATFALDVTVKVLEYYETYFGIPYPLPKLDLIAIPDFEAGAMENWGLVTYRETALLIDPQQSSAAARQRVAIVVAHELAHQWFGNLVTMHWWNDLWLNEGFASWMEYKAVDHLFPEWDIWTQFYNDNTAVALAEDGLKNSHPIEVEVINPNEINEAFSAVVYNKGASLIHMLEQYLGEETFRKGLQDYLHHFRYKNAITHDLWNFLGKAAGKPIKKIMSSWTTQAGYPVVSVAAQGKKWSLRQERFFFTGRKSDKAVWNMPLAIEENNRVRYHEFKKRTATMLVSDEDANLNAQQLGFYLVQYDEKLLKKKIEKIKTKQLPTLDRIGLQNNVHALSVSGYMKATDYLALVRAYEKETDYTVWADLSGNIGFIAALFAHDHFSAELEELIRDVFSDIFANVSWNESPGEEHTRILLRSVVLTTLGLNNHQAVLEEAKRKFTLHLQERQLNPNLRAVVYMLAAWSGDKETYDQILNLYREATLQEEKIRLLRALGRFQQKELLQRTLALSLSPDVRSQDTLSGIASVAANPHGQELAWEFFKNNWKVFDQRYGKSGHLMPYFVDATTARFSTKEKYKDVQQFFRKNKARTAQRAVKQALESITVNERFVNRNREEIAAWLKTYKHE